MIICKDFKNGTQLPDYITLAELKNYTLIYNSEKENDKKSIMWLQSMDDGDIAFPVMTPDIIMPDYKPTVNEELLAPLGDLNEENMYVIVTVNVPSDITKIACNLKAPIVVNTDSNKAAQLIVEDDYKVHLCRKLRPKPIEREIYQGYN